MYTKCLPLTDHDSLQGMSTCLSHFLAGLADLAYLGERDTADFSFDSSSFAQTRKFRPLNYSFEVIFRATLACGRTKIVPLAHRHVTEVRGWGLINGLVLKDDSPILAGHVVAETTALGLLLVPAGLKVAFSIVVVSQMPVCCRMTSSDVPVTDNVVSCPYHSRGQTPPFPLVRFDPRLVYSSVHFSSARLASGRAVRTTADRH